MKNKISVEALKGVGIFYEGDIYDLACILLKLDDAQDKGTSHRSRHTVYGVAGHYAMLTRESREKIVRILERHGLPLGATVEHDEDVR
jgi:hypothetical protein